MSIVQGVVWAVVLCRPAQAQEPWTRAPLEAAPDEVLKAAEAFKPDDDASVVLLARDSHWTIEADGRGTQRFRLAYRVVTREGVQGASTCRAHWSPWFQDRPVVRARVVTPDGQAHLLNPDTLTEKPVVDDRSDIITDRRVLTGPLPAVKPGAVVEMEIVTRDAKPHFAGGVVRRERIGASLTLHRDRLTVDAPESLEIRHASYRLGDFAPRKTTEGGRSVLVWERAPVKPAEPGEAMAPGDVQVVPLVAFSTGRRWSDVAEAYRAIVEEQIAKADLGGLGPLPGADEAPGERAARILALVQARVRYTSLALGEASIVPRPPAETLKRGYGDCKDKSALLVAALRACGIPAHLALLETGPGPDVDPDLPGFGVFNHAIVKIDGPPDAWVDPTDKYGRVGELPLAVQGRLALIVKPGIEQLVRTPQAAPADNTDVRLREIHLSDYGPCRVIETFRPKGSRERDLRQNFDQDRASVGSMLENYARSAFLGAKVKDHAAAPPADLTAAFEARIEMTDARRGATDLREAVCAIPVAGLWSDLPELLLPDDEDEEAPKRVHDVVLFLPYVTEWRYLIHPPPGFEPRPLPRSDTTELGPARLSKELRALPDGRVEVVVRFDTVKARYTPDEVGRLRAAVARAKSQAGLVVGFVQRGQAHLEAGRIKEALGEFRALAAQRPDKGLHVAQIARALLAAGLGDAARREARRAVEVEKGSWLAHQTLAWVLTHDLLGRRFRKGWDPEGAEAALREVLKLEPGQMEATVDLAILLEYDAAGRRYAPGPRLERAIELYRSVSDGRAKQRLVANLSLALLWVGRLEELHELHREPKTQIAALFALVTRAVREGSDVALRFASRQIADVDVRRQCLAEAGEILIKLRHYAQAGDLLAAAARGAAQAGNLLGRADQIRKTRRWSEVPADDGTPAAFVRRFTYLLLAPDFDASTLKPLLSRHFLAMGTDKETTEAFQAVHRQIVDALSKQDVPLDAVRDILMSGLDPSIEGEADLGFKAVVPMLNGSTQIWFLHPEEGGLRLLGEGGAALGRAALERVEAGDLEKARRWLDWALPEQAPAGREGPDQEPFTVFWKKGGPADAAALRRAAVALAVGSGPTEDLLRVLEKERAAAKDREAFALDLAGARALLLMKRYDAAEERARAMAAAEPDSKAAYFIRGEALRRLRKFDDLVAMSEARLRKNPEDRIALYSLQHHESLRGNYGASQDYGRRILKLEGSDPGVYNNIAWSALLEGKVTEQTLKDAQQAVMGHQGKADHSLHTLATVYADLGRPVEARDVLLQTFQARPHAEPEPHDWYVLGRIAEEYGALEAAREAYRKTADEEDCDLPNSTNNLSLRRLRILDGR